MPPKKKKLAAIIKLQIKAGAANPAPPVGPALGQHGVNIMEFCKAYNAATESQRGQVVPVEISVYEDRSFTFMLKTPPAARAAAQGRRRGEGQRRAAQDQGRQGQPGPGPRDRPDQDGRPQRQRPRRRPRRSSPAPPGRWASPSKAERSSLGSGWSHVPRPVGTSGRARAGRRPARPRLIHVQKDSIMKRSKAYRQAAELIDRGPALHARSRPPSSPRRPRRPRSTPPSRSPCGSGVDPRKADQMVRGTVNLPHGTGKTARVIVFATGDKAAEAEAAGADVVGSRRPDRAHPGRLARLRRRRSPRPTRWPRSAGSPASSARVA